MIPVVVPSHKRWERVLVKDVIEDVIVCVPEDQEAQYREHNPDVEILSHPLTVDNLAKKRQWIYEKFGSVFMVDDDVYSMQKLYTGPGETEVGIKDKQVAREIIENTGQAALEAGIFIWGFAVSAQRIHYTPMTPYRFSGYCNGMGLGLHKSPELYFDPEFLVCNDMWISLLNAYHHRKTFFDQRFSFHQRKTMKNAGGLSDVRTLDLERRLKERLRSYFGPQVVRKRLETESNGRGSKGKGLHEYQVEINLPF